MLGFSPQEEVIQVNNSNLYSHNKFQCVFCFRLQDTSSYEREFEFIGKMLTLPWAIFFIEVVGAKM